MKRTLLLVAFAVSACQTTGSGSNPLQGIFYPPAGGAPKLTAESYCRDLSGYPTPTEEEEYFLGRATTAKLLTSYGLQNLLPPDDALTVYVRKVGLLVAGTAGEHIDAPGLQRAKANVADRKWPLTGYHFLVVRSAVANAHGMPGGYVVVTTGLLERVKSEDELAGVLAHEVAHVHRGHGVELVSLVKCMEENERKSILGQVNAQGAYAAGSVDRHAKDFAGMDSGLQKKWHAAYDKLVTEEVEKMVANGRGAELELEADAVGVRFASWAGYGAGGLGEVLGRLPAPQKKGLLGGASSSHPPAKERIARLQALCSSEKLPVTIARVDARDARFKEALDRLPPSPEQSGGSGAGGN